MVNEVKCDQKLRRASTIREVVIPIVFEIIKM